MAWLCLCLGNLNAQNFNNTYFPNEFQIGPDADNYWHINRSASTTTQPVFNVQDYNQDEWTGWFKSKYFIHAINVFEIQIDDNEPVRLNAQAEFTPIIPVGKHRITLRSIITSINNPDHIWTERTVNFEVKEGSPYIAPDDVWEISLGAEEFVPPVNDLYPEGHVFAEEYNGQNEREAVAIIKYGEGNNNQLTRPLIMVDGVDFQHDIVIDPSSNRIIRYGSTGWENVIQGVTSSFTREGEQELFRAYPEVLNKALTEENVNGNANYDIILVEFRDGADYIGRCAKLLEKVIARINQEKVCGYENVIVGMSMGGQVARRALAEMEHQGKEHDSRMYISFDSPQEFANIPLGIQATVYAAGVLGENASIAASFNDLNRPAAIQMLRYNLYTEVNQGNVSIMNFSLGYKKIGLLDFELTPNLETNHQLPNSPKTIELRNEYVNKRSALGYPKYCKNIAISQGSGIGEPLSNSTCLLSGFTTLDASFLNNFVTHEDPTIENLIEEALQAYVQSHTDIFTSFVLGIDMHSIGAEGNLILGVQFLNIENKEKLLNIVRVIKNIDYPNIDVAPGCARTDVRFLRNEFNDAIERISFLDAPEWTCDEVSTTFMPTASVIGVQTDDLTMDLDKAIKVDQIMTTPFDEIFMPVDNLEHVEIIGEDEVDLAGNDIAQFLLEHINDNIYDMPSTVILPSVSSGSHYNYGLDRHRLTDFTVNNGGLLSINHTGATHFVDTDASQESNKEEFSVVTLDHECSPAQIITINNEGRLELGEQSTNKTGHIDVLNGSALTINAGGELRIFNGSSLTIREGATASFSNTNILMKGNETKLSLAGNVSFNGDVTIQCNGKIEILSTANITINGSLTINGDVMNDKLLDLHENIALVVNGDFNITNGTILFRGNNKIEVKNGYQSIFQNIKMLEKGNINSEIHIKNVSNVLISTVEANFFLQTTPFRIEGTGSESVQIENSMIKNSGNALILNNLNSVQINGSQFISEGTVLDEFRISNGIDADKIRFLTIENSSFDGFIYNPKLLFKDPNPDKNVRYALQLKDANTTRINGSSFSNSDYGILVPEQGLFPDNEVNETNIYMHGVKILNNLIGVDMSGGFASSSAQLNYGHLYLECTRILDNHEKGIRGVNVILSADNYFANGENEVNYFKPYDNTPINTGGLIDLNYSFNDNYINPLLLRGNVWYTSIPSQFISATSGSIPLIVETYPEYGSEDFPTINGCYTLKDEKDMKGDCLGCFTSDDTDGGFALNSNGKTIMETLREGIRHISDGDLVTAKATFQHIANVPSATIKTLHAKSQYAYELSRVYATPEASFGNRSKSNAHSLVKLDLAIYPNPTTSDISLDVTEAGDYRITSVNGEVVQTGTYQVNDLIQLQDNTPGIYFVYFKSQSGLEKTGRFILVK